jgi:hypothetical protein
VEKPDMNPELARVCIHESGHAVMAKALGVLVTGVRIIDEGTGWCRTSRATEYENLLIAWAGPEAERLLFGFARAAQVACDLEHIEQHERRCGLSAVVMADTRLHVRDVLQQNWHRVLRVAEQLVKRRHLDALLLDTYSFGNLESMWRRSQRLPARRTAA